MFSCSGHSNSKSLWSPGPSEFWSDFITCRHWSWRWDIAGHKVDCDGRCSCGGFLHEPQGSKPLLERLSSTCKKRISLSRKSGGTSWCTYTVNRCICGNLLVCDSLEIDYRWAQACAQVLEDRDLMMAAVVKCCTRRMQHSRKVAVKGTEWMLWFWSSRRTWSICSV